MGKRKQVIDEPNRREDLVEANWGPWLFRLFLLATLVFFWWLVIYDHGLAPAPG